MAQLYNSFSYQCFYFVIVFKLLFYHRIFLFLQNKSRVLVVLSLIVFSWYFSFPLPIIIALASNTLGIYNFFMKGEQVMKNKKWISTGAFAQG